MMFSKIRTGSGSSSAVHSMPRASSSVAGASTLMPGIWAYQPSRLCECWAASWRPPPVASRITSGTPNWFPDICRMVAAVLRIWSSASRLKFTVINSTIGRAPAIAAPMPAPVKPDSDKGVSRIRSGPNSARRPLVTA